MLNKGQHTYAPARQAAPDDTPKPPAPQTPPLAEDMHCMGEVTLQVRIQEDWHNGRVLDSRWKVILENARHVF